MTTFNIAIDLASSLQKHWKTLDAALVLFTELYMTEKIYKIVVP